ncbi:MAG: dienelactone hydrolase family protein [Paracoccaceae bacterium]
MKYLHVFFSLAVLFVLGGSPAPVAAEQTVHFKSPDVQPTPFRLKRAKAKGITLKPTPGMEFKGLLFTPDGSGPHPAVVILESGGGQLNSHVLWAKTLAEWGYVSLLVDSFASRGVTNMLETQAIDMTVEGFAAFTFLSGLDAVDEERIGILGFSAGGSFLFPVVRAENKLRPPSVHYRAAVSYYPTCNIGYVYRVPIMVLFGDKDRLSSLAQCKTLIDESGPDGSISLHVYKGATHFFDSTDYSKDRSLHGVGWRKPLWFETNDYDPEAHKDSLTKTRAFFDEYLD